MYFNYKQKFGWIRSWTKKSPKIFPSEQEHSANIFDYVHVDV